MSTGEYGVLLYYKYTTIPDLTDLFNFYHSNCTSLGLIGRVRLAPDGVNVTVGGMLSSLEKHIAALKLNNTLFEGTDFKLATCEEPLNDKVARECGFTNLSVRIVEELVTFSSHPLLKSPEISKAGKHLSAVEFHSILQSADQESPIDSKGFVLLDARNVYETRIGKFHTLSVETLDPGIRQYSELPSWIDKNSEHLQGKSVLMYCTGGIRCEMASAYIRSKGTGFENVFQLYGGIQRYLEQFPDGGFFKGKNFVFDHRISVGSSDSNIMGTCLICNICFDDYSSRCRCTYCRMLVLVCDSCQGSPYVCELCKKHGKVGSLPSIENERLQIPSPEFELKESNTILSPHQPQGHGTGRARRLRILCLHGFRQNAPSFKGRTASLAKKLKNIAEFVFVDAPHEVPFIYQPCAIEPLHNCKSAFLNESPPPVQNCKKKFAWLIEPDMNGSNENSWKMADSPFDPLQYQKQTNGLEVSLAYLKNVFSREGPFDGILGFSQGAAMTASVCLQQLRVNSEMCFRFVILCSGFAIKLEESERGSINCPSLHIFGGDQCKDRQIANQASRDLAMLFEDGCSVIIEHECGHIIPTRSPYINEIKDFLQRFL